MAKKDQFFNRAAACEAHDDIPRSGGSRNPAREAPFAEDWIPAFTGMTA
jgi:hypothetical protein